MGPGVFSIVVISVEARRSTPYPEIIRFIDDEVGWHEAHQEQSFAGWFKPDEVSIITADGTDVGWIQQRPDRDAIFPGSIYVIPTMQGKASALTSSGPLSVWQNSGLRR
jgi:hypothetical protein